VLLAWFWNYNIWIGILSCLFMAWGDGVTGVVRYAVYKRRTKGAWGNIAMLILCGGLGYFLLGYVGLIGGAFSSVLEKFEKVDDNISVPLGSAVVMTALGLL
jgi:dolichol kinase